jgi:hypothetical protein
MLLFAAAPDLPLSVRIPLSVMNLLQFAIWGAWFVVLGNYLDALKFSRKDIGRIYATMALGSVISPIFVGTIADRYFASEQLMAVLHLAGAALLFWMSQIRTSGMFYLAALLYAIAYAPTLALSNSVIFSHILDTERDFPTIRVLGTIGWIIASASAWLFIKPGQPVNNRPLQLAAFLSLALGVFSFFLPHTPPGAAGSGAEAKAIVENGKIAAVEVVKHGEGYQKPPGITIVGGGKDAHGAALTAVLKDGSIESITVDKPGEGYTEAPQLQFPQATIPFLQALDLLKDPSFAVFFGVSFFITIALAFYYSFTALYLETAIGVKPKNVGPLMSIGQWMEIIFLLGLTFVLKSKEHPDRGFVSMKDVLIIGMAAWGLRYAIFSMRPPLALVLVGIGLHGICFDFFFAAAFIHVANTAPSHIVASGQTLFSFLTYGVGMWLGTEASGYLNQALTKEVPDPATGQMKRVTDWRTFWLVPCIGVVVCLTVFVLLF